MAELVAKRYAEALLGLAMERGKLEAVTAEAEAFLPALSEDVFKTLLHPGATPTDKIGIIESLKGKVDDDILGLCVLIINKRREEYLLVVLEQFIEMAKKELGLTVAYVRSAVPLTDTQLNNIEAKLSKSLNKQVTISAEVEPELLGGLYVKVGGRVFDGTIKTELANIRKRLLNDK